MGAQPAPTVLLIDDDPAVLDALHELFVDEFATILAGTGKQAVDAVQQHPSITLAVLDMKMAHMDGIETYRKIVKLSPKLRIIIHAGNPMEYLSLLDDSPQPFAVVKKGTSIAELVKAVREGCGRSEQ